MRSQLQDWGPSDATLGGVEEKEEKRDEGIPYKQGTVSGRVYTVLDIPYTITACTQDVGNIAP